MKIIINCGLCFLWMTVFRKSYKYEMYFLRIIEYTSVQLFQNPRKWGFRSSLRVYNQRPLEKHIVWKVKKITKSRTQRKLRSSISTVQLGTTLCLAQSNKFRIELTYIPESWNILFLFISRLIKSIAKQSLKVNTTLLPFQGNLKNSYRKSVTSGAGFELLHERQLGVCCFRQPAILYQVDNFRKLYFFFTANVALHWEILSKKQHLL